MLAGTSFYFFLLSGTLWPGPKAKLFLGLWELYKGVRAGAGPGWPGRWRGWPSAGPSPPLKTPQVVVL